jgi:cytochrome c556
MRIALLAATASLVLIAGCRGPEGSQANDAQANIGNDAQSPATANASAVTGGLGAPVSGDEAKQIMDERHEGMEEIGDAMKAAGGALKASAPDLEKVRKEAATIARLAPEVSGWFPPGTGPDVGKTRAKAEIWQKPEDFAARTRDFQQKAQAFNAAAQGGDVAAITAAQGELGKTCKGCHDPYQAKKGEAH